MSQSKLSALKQNKKPTATKGKKAHMADLQAEAAVNNMLSDIAGNPQQHQFKVELICIVDSITSGVLVYRSEKRAIIFKSRLFHWAKLLFERIYLSQIR